MTETERELPRPAAGRWRPLRCGLVELFHYDSQEFWFRDGRLLLRGNNGTGKSKVLALTLPFLFDGSLAPHRVEPDGDRGKRMEWNLLLGGEYEERTGYSWLEFGRRDETGVEHFFTIGIGMRAIAGRPDIRRWFFTTDQRIGNDITLVDATKTVLSRDRLSQALENRGSVYETAVQYRRAVDERLFHLGEERYGALVELLIQLRQPQLSKRPDEGALSHSLSEALAPLDQAIIADVATAFQNLEEDQDELDQLTAVRDAVDHFATGYLGYARLAVLRATASPRSAQSDYERENRELTGARAALEESRLESVGQRQAVESFETDLAGLVSEIEALREAATAKGSDLLDAAATALAAAQASVRKAEHEHESADEQLSTVRERHELSSSDLEREEKTVSEHRDSLLSAATRAGLEPQVTQLLIHDDRNVIEDTQRPDSHGHLTEALNGILAEGVRRTSHVAEMRRRLEELEGARIRLRQQRGTTDLAEENLASAEDSVKMATHAVEEGGTTLLTATRDHLLAAIELRESASAPLANAIAALEQWIDTRADENPATLWVEMVHREHADTIGGVAAQVNAKIDDITGVLDKLTEQIDVLDSGHTSEPDPPPTRFPGIRESHDGAAFWRCIDFPEELLTGERAGLEAALQASGLLDAWVTIDAQVIGLHGDTILTARPLPQGVRTLADVLTVEHSAPVACEIIEELLRSIAVDASPAASNAHAAVNVSGTFRLGPLTGHWEKESAQYIGATARDNDRRRRLAEAHAEREALIIKRERLLLDHKVLIARREVLDAERRAVPSGRELAEADATLAAALRHSQEQSEKVAVARISLAAATAETLACSNEVSEGALELALPSEEEELRDIQRAITDLDVSIRLLRTSAASRTAARLRLDQLEEDLTRTSAVATTRTEELASATKTRGEAEVRHSTLDSSVGVEVRQLVEQRTVATTRRNDMQAQLTSARKASEAAQVAYGESRGRVGQLEQRVAERTNIRAEAAIGFREFARTGLIAITVPEVPLPAPTDEWAPDPTVRFARRVYEALGSAEVTVEQWNSAQTGVGRSFEELARALSPYSYHAERSMAGDVVTVAVRYGADERTAHELVATLTAQVDDRRTLLTAREREILQNHLVDEVASTLQELIEAAERQKRDINEELAKRPTSTGVRLRIRWEPRSDGPTGYGEARGRILRQTADVWSSEDRDAIATFLQERISTVKTENPAGTWVEHLTLALDYRAWNEFRIDIEQGGKWRPASGPASGGERVLAASVPLFAAASAHYRSAGNPFAPRIITLDEAFAGVDDSSRAGYLGLLATFDLDVVMTSEREWACYPEVPGIGIAQIIRTEGIDGILVERWEWDGVSRELLPNASADPHQGIVPR